MTTGAQIWTLVGLGLVWAFFDFLDRRHKRKQFIFPRREKMKDKIFVCPICGFDCHIGGTCPNHVHPPAEMVERILANKTQEPGTTDLISRIFNEKGERHGEK